MIARVIGRLCAGRQTYQGHTWDLRAVTLQLENGSTVELARPRDLLSTRLESWPMGKEVFVVGNLASQGRAS
jgi:hypothetical protein